MIKLGIDIDGVLANFTEAALEVMDGLWPGRVPADYVQTTWDWSDIGITSDDMKQLWATITNAPNFWHYVHSYGDNVEDLWAYAWNHTKDREIYFVTARARTAGDSLLSQTAQWLTSRGLITPGASIIPMARGKSKSQIFDAIGIDVSIDDYDVNVRESIALAKNGHEAYLLDQPWNRSAHDLDHVRLHSIKEFLEKVESNK